MTSNKIYVKLFSVIAFLIMVSMNALANLRPMNGVTTGELSNIYPTLITPAGYTFLIWSFIYILLFAYTIYQMEFFDHKRKLSHNISGHINVFFVISCILNATWVVAWHYEYIALSLMVIIILLICLGFINYYLDKEDLSIGEKFFMRLPFGIYFGWITVATVINVAVLLVSIGWLGYGIPESVWTIIGAALILFPVFYYTVKNKSLAYAATAIWAYIGILVKHTSENGFSGSYPKIIAAIIIYIVVLVFAMGFVIIKRSSMVRCQKPDLDI